MDWKYFLNIYISNYLTFLSIFSRWQLIQNLAPFTILWRQCVAWIADFQRIPGINPITTSTGRNQLIYECHVTKPDRNRVKHSCLSFQNGFRFKLLISFGVLVRDHLYITVFWCFIEPASHPYALILRISSHTINSIFFLEFQSKVSILSVRLKKLSRPAKQTKYLKELFFSRFFSFFLRWSQPEERLSIGKYLYAGQ